MAALRLCSEKYRFGRLIFTFQLFFSYAQVTHRLTSRREHLTQDPRLRCLWDRDFFPDLQTQSDRAYRVDMSGPGRNTGFGFPLCFLHACIVRGTFGRSMVRSIVLSRYNKPNHKSMTGTFINNAHGFPELALPHLF